jgi:4,5-dihydroxyphthalate decarboxylase
MPDISLTLACWNYDRCNPLLDGTVTIPGIELTAHALPPGQLFPLAVSSAPYDITEMSASSYLMQVASGEGAYQAIPVFVSRAFRHGGIYVRADGTINTPKDLEGKRVGVPEYQMTMALWTRGILADEYGVDTDKLKYRTGGTNKAGRKERLSLDLPEHLDVRPIDESRSLNDLFIAGELDAIISPEPPFVFQDGSGQIKRLFGAPGSAERAYYQKTGLFPIMHMIGIRKSLIKAHPGLATDIHNAFVAARRMTMEDMKITARASANRVNLPWFSAEWEATVELMGAEFWPYGIAENRSDLNAMCRYSFEQHLSPRQLDTDELFASETLNLSGI